MRGPSESPPAENLLELKFKELLLNIISNKKNQELTNYLYKLAKSNLDDLETIMETNCYYNMQLSEYARLCYRSLSTYKRDFYNSFGVTPGQWLLQKRLNRSAYLLSHTDSQVTDVVHDSGFKNISHFNKAFKKQFGSSPLQYRRNNATVIAFTE